MGILQSTKCKAFNWDISLFLLFGLVIEGVPRLLCFGGTLYEKLTVLRIILELIDKR